MSDWIPVCMLEVPAVKDRAGSRERWLTEIKVLKKKLEILTGEGITPSQLKEAVRLLHRRQAAFRKLHEIRKSSPPVINGRDALLVSQASFFDDPARWTEKVKELCRELEDKAKRVVGVCPAQTPRLLLADHLAKLQNSSYY